MINFYHVFQMLINMMDEEIRVIKKGDKNLNKKNEEEKESVIMIRKKG